MSRLSAFACFVCAAFAWVPPGIDRPGLAALGLGFLTWSVGRGFGFLRKTAPALPSLAELGDLLGQTAEPEPETEARDRYTAEGWASS